MKKNFECGRFCDSQTIHKSARLIAQKCDLDNTVHAHTTIKQMREREGKVHKRGRGKNHPKKKNNPKCFFIVGKKRNEAQAQRKPKI